MRIDWYEIMVFVLTVLTLFGVLAWVGGCGILQPKEAPTEVLPDTVTVKQHIYTTLHKSDWLVTASILGIGAGFFSFLNGGTRGLQIMAACLVVLSFTLMIGRFATVLSVATAVGAAALLFYTVFIKDKALKEIIGGVQNFKNRWDPVDEDPVSALKYQLDKQSSTTKEVVSKVKKDNGFDKL